MRKIQLESKAFEDIQFWLANDRRLLQKIMKLMQEAQRTPFEGLGKPEALKGDMSGYWSRRIDQEHRMVYEATDDLLIVHSLHGHYI
jgi:toxin YoeB